MRAVGLSLLLLIPAGALLLLIREGSDGQRDVEARVAPPKAQAPKAAKHEAIKPEPAATKGTATKPTVIKSEAKKPKATPIEDVTDDSLDEPWLSDAPWEGFLHECPLPPPMVFEGPDPNGWSRAPNAFPSRPVRR